MFERCWHDGGNLADQRAVEAVLKEIGVAVAGFAAFSLGDGRAELDRVQAQLRGRGVFEVPTYLVNDEVFLGRQHLPLLRALLSP